MGKETIVRCISFAPGSVKTVPKEDGVGGEGSNLLLQEVE